MWTLSMWTVIVTVLVLAGAYALHRWVGVRRQVLGDRFADLADTFWGKVWEWIKRRWDWAAAAALAIGPVLWSTGLDVIVITANLLANILPALSGIDLSKFMLSDTTKAYIQLGGLVIPPIRDAIEKLKS